MENEHKRFGEISIFLTEIMVPDRGVCDQNLTKIAQENNSITFVFVFVLVFNMIKLLAKIKQVKL